MSVPNMCTTSNATNTAHLVANARHVKGGLPALLNEITADPKSSPWPPGRSNPYVSTGHGVASETAWPGTTARHVSTGRPVARAVAS
eukprot:2589310-Rhodomonas_salina.3